MKERILSALADTCTWKNSLHWFDTIGSTNTRAKEMAANGAPHGTVLIANQQTAGRGRLGRSFHSAAGKGIYLSVILRPNCNPEQLMHLTCAAGVAACTAIEHAAGYRPRIKWINDLVADKQKLGGILTELSIDPSTQRVLYAIVGIGINCTHTKEDFPKELQNLATSLLSITGITPDLASLAAALVSALWEMDRCLLTDRTRLMQRYRNDCMTLGQHVVVLRGTQRQYGKALDIGDDGSLCVQYDDGITEWVCSGEVSIRGMYGYTS